MCVYVGSTHLFELINFNSQSQLKMYLNFFGVVVLDL